MPTTQHSFTLTNWLFAVGPTGAWLAQAPAAASGNALAGNLIGGGLAGNAGAGAGGNALGGGLFGSPGGGGSAGNALGGGLFGSPGGGGSAGNALGGGLIGGSTGGGGATSNALGGGLIVGSPGGGSTGNALGGGLIGGSSRRAGASGNVIASNAIGAGIQASGGAVSPICMSVDTDFVRAHLKWLSAWVMGSASPLDCALIACDFNRTPVEQLTYQKARVTRLTFTALDASLRTPWLLGIELTPTSVQWQKGGSSVRVPPQKRTWTGCNDFELIVDGASMNKVARAEIAAMSAPGVLPALTLRIPSSDVQAFDDWRRSGRTAACALNIISPIGSPLVALKFRGRPTSIKPGGGSSSTPPTMASVELSASRPSLT